MFDAYCASCEARVLLGPRCILKLSSTPSGVVARFRCPCGQVGEEWFRARGHPPGAELSATAGQA